MLISLAHNNLYSTQHLILNQSKSHVQIKKKIRSILPRNTRYRECRDTDRLVLLSIQSRHLISNTCITADSWSWAEHCNYHWHPRMMFREYSSTKGKLPLIAVVASSIMIELVALGRVVLFVFSLNCMKDIQDSNMQSIISQWKKSIVVKI